MKAGLPGKQASAFWQQNIRFFYHLLWLKCSDTLKQKQKKLRLLVHDWRSKTILEGLARWRKWLRSSPCTPGIPYGRRFYPCSPASLPAHCLWHKKAVEDGPQVWDPAPALENWRRRLASDQHSISRCAHLGSESSDGRSSSLSLLSVYLPFQ